MADEVREAPLDRSSSSQASGSSPRPILSMFPIIIRTMFIKKDGARKIIKDNFPIFLYLTLERVRVLSWGHSPVLQKARKSCFPSNKRQAARTFS